MADIRRVTDSFAVAPQIDIDDFSSIQSEGFVHVVNNRPDDETFGQMPSHTAREKAAENQLAYTAIPIAGPHDLTASVDALNAAISSSAGPVLAYCRSGTRSISLWSLASVKSGAETPESAIEKARNAGYDLSHLQPLMQQFHNS